MSAGTGVTHSEFNHSPIELLHFLQIWILPERRGLPPGYEQKSFSEEDRRGRLCLIGSHDGRKGSVTIRQDVDLHAARLSPRDRVTLPLARGRAAWVQIARGQLALDGEELEAGDGAAVEDKSALELAARAESELLVFDLA
jgi:hypothetical protein